MRRRRTIAHSQPINWIWTAYTYILTHTRSTAPKLNNFTNYQCNETNGGYITGPPFEQCEAACRVCTLSRHRSRSRARARKCSHALVPIKPLVLTYTATREINSASAFTRSNESGGVTFSARCWYAINRLKKLLEVLNWEKVDRHIIRSYIYS